MCSHNLNRLIGTAVVDKAFRQALLADPARAASEFNLAPEEFLLVSSIRAQDITDFAQKLDAALHLEIVPAVGPSLPLVQRREETRAFHPSFIFPDRPLALHLHAGG